MNFSDKMKKEPSKGAEKKEPAKAVPDKKKSGFADFWSKAAAKPASAAKPKPAEVGIVPKKVSSGGGSKPEETKGNKPQIPAAPAWRNGQKPPQPPPGTSTGPVRPTKEVWRPRNQNAAPA